MSEHWKKQDRPCPPCPHCGAELYEKFWGNGGWVPSDVGTDNAHGNCIRIVSKRLTKTKDMLASAMTVIESFRPLAVAAKAIVDDGWPVLASNAHLPASLEARLVTLREAYEGIAWYDRCGVGRSYD